MYEATITAKGQITIPVEVRRYLKLKTGDVIRFTISDTGIVAFEKNKNDIVCPACSGKRVIEGRECPICKGEGIIPKIITDTEEYINNMLQFLKSDEGKNYINEL